jgi:hypothetical protein
MGQIPLIIALDEHEAVVHEADLPPKPPLATTLTKPSAARTR